MGGVDDLGGTFYLQLMAVGWFAIFSLLEPDGRFIGSMLGIGGDGISVDVNEGLWHRSTHITKTKITKKKSRQGTL